MPDWTTERWTSTISAAKATRSVFVARYDWRVRLGTVLLITRETLGTVGEADREFGLSMLEKMLHALEGEPERPSAICFYTEGVRLVCRGSHVLLGLRLLEGLGVRLLACQSCLEHYGLAGSVAVGEIGNMKQIAGLMMSAGKVVTV